MRGNPGNSPKVWRYTGRRDIALEWWIRHTSLLQRYVADPCKTYSEALSLGSKKSARSNRVLILTEQEGPSVD